MIEQTLTEYIQTIQEIREQLNPNYFSTAQLKQDIDRNRKIVENIYKNTENEKKCKAQQKYIRAHYLDCHPQRQCFYLIDENGKIQKNKQNQFENIRTFSQFVQPNSEIKINLKLLKMMPMRKPYANFNYSPNMPENFSILAYHGDQKAQISNLQYCSLLNLHKGLNSTKNKSTKLRHTVTKANYQIKMDVFDSQCIKLYFQTYHKLIVAQSAIDLYQFIGEKNLKKQVFVDFNKIGSLSQTLFTLKLELSVEICPIAPDMRDLACMLPPKKVISKSPAKSRSPSPQAHKRLAKQVSAPKQQFFQVYPHTQTIIKIEQKLYNYQQTQVVIQKQQNIHQHEFGLMKKQENYKNQLFLRVKLKCTDEKESGHIWIAISQHKYYIKVLPDSRFNIWSPQIAIQKLKDVKNYDQINSIVQITQNCLIKPNQMVKICKYPVEISCTINCIGSFFIKTDREDVSIMGHPLQKDNMYIRKGENGHMVHFIITQQDLQWMEKPKIKSLAINQLGQDYMTSSFVVFSLQTKVSSKDLFEIHYVLCHFRKMKPDVKIRLQVEKTGSYFLNMASITRRNGRFRMRSSNQNILKIQLQYFDQNSINQHIPVFLVCHVENQCKVLVFLDDLQKNMTTPIEITICQINPQFSYK